MIRLSELTEALTETLADRVAELRVVRGNELHCSVRPLAVAALAVLLRRGFGAELVFMAAADRRADRGVFEVHYLFAPEREPWFLHATAAVPADAPALGSLATFHYPASRFEREIYDLFGITAEGHPDPRPLVRHGFWPADYFPLRKDAGAREFSDDGQAFPFTEVGGEGVYEIPVGPVHAGIIEPGHFRFSVVGETII
ncbi:MAG: NADH-quinone oxidoreductase subunit C, partial [Candidatus Rokubacteria bacterium]|nr:NADH-quinone oxidoreductase subunit C [Candidatus Rokubacteria bacterium]